MAWNDTDIIELKCDRCGEPITIKYGTYRKTKNQPHLCRKCRGEDTSKLYNSLSEEEKAKRRKAQSDGWAKQSDEKKAQDHQNKVNAWANDPERRAKTAQQMSDRWNSMSESQQQAWVNRINDARQDYWNDPNNRATQADLHRELYYKQFDTPEKMHEFAMSGVKGQQEWKAKLTPSYLDALREQRILVNHQMWKQLTPEEKQWRIQVLKLGKQPEIDNPLEIAVADYLTRNHLDVVRYCFNKVQNPEFYKRFPTDPYHPNSMLMWFHQWDMIVKTNVGPVFLDVDGSIHDPKRNPNPSRMIQYSNFKDSQRKYQTDGLPAYIVQAYDAHINSATPVVSVYDETVQMTLGDFVRLFSTASLDEADSERIDALMRVYTDDEDRLDILDDEGLI